MTAVVTEPGIYQLDETAYHADPTPSGSLSVSGAKTLLRDPARYQWERSHGRPNKTAFDLGTLAHALILRGGDNRIRVIDAYDWRTKAAQDARKAAYAERMTPVHRGDLLQAAKIAQAVRRHPLAGAILRGGTPERSMFWDDPDTGVPLRGRVDYVHPKALVDLKTAAYGGSHHDVFAKAAANFDYPMQAANYTDGWHTLTGDLLPFLFVVVEVDPPYFVRVFQLTDADLAAGRERMRAAIDRYAEYEATGWPGTSTDIDTLTMPRWYAA